MMLKAQTPFKIHDENQGVSKVKAGKSVTSFKSNAPAAGGDGLQKKGLQQSGAKTGRKALSSLSSNQINIRLASTPAQTVNLKPSSTVVKSAKPIAPADDNYVDDFTPEDMLCTRMAADVDPWDVSRPKGEMIREAAASADMSWLKDLPDTLLDTTRDEDAPIEFEYDFEEQLYLQHTVALSSQTLLDLSGYES